MKRRVQYRQNPRDIENSLRIKEFLWHLCQLDDRVQKGGRPIFINQGKIKRHKLPNLALDLTPKGAAQVS